MEVHIGGDELVISCNQVVYNEYGNGPSFNIWLGRDYSSIDKAKEIHDKFGISYDKSIDEYFIKVTPNFMSIREDK